MALLLWAFTAQAQIHEIGGSLGAANYVGDLVRNYSLHNHRPMGSIHYRYNLNDFSSLRANIMVGKLVGSDTHEPYDAFAAARSREQFNNWVNDLTFLYEYNFFDYKNPDKDFVRWTPYFMIGVGMMLQHGYDAYNSELAATTGGFANLAYSGARKTYDFKNYQPILPVGVGIKYMFNPNWTVGIEWMARKTFFDYLDNTGDVENKPGNLYQYGNTKHNDWYFTTGLTLSYTFWTIPCPYKFDNRKYL